MPTIMTGKYKSEAVVEKDALAGWLRDLADGIEAGELPSQAGPVSLEGLRGMKLSVKPDLGETLSVKLSVKFPKPVRTPGEPDAEDEEGDETGMLPKYKSLKKHMKQTFRAIGDALAAGQMPPALEAQSFIADSRLMVSYPGKGDEFYAAYLEKTEAFQAALDAADLEAMKALHQELNQLKRDCHSRHA
ncbi:MAG: GAK system XXXCH domain-containing protein [Acidobacteriota bacterium]